ncbi:receptor-type tyrosine-protein phosphatase U isoform X1 [Lates japonicus]|uniref:Receptor-type tyrosine-protein phosphatase U isoform X1 n=1 Tax=Lates japonicus TaxID=270547 RepID=A0AAD3RBA3_LATJO|nr:receptor-type tyrosine-protein phosphatase U isoform X1 [Lates japonicus]
MSGPLSTSPAGCTFDEDSDPGLCEYRQGQEDDFDWQLIRTYNWPHPTPDLLRGTAPPGQAGYVNELPGIGGV